MGDNSTPRGSGRKAVIHVQKIPASSPRALRSGKQLGESSATSFKHALESSAKRMTNELIIGGIRMDEEEDC